MRDFAMNDGTDIEHGNQKGYYIGIFSRLGTEPDWTIDNEAH
jgi:hypothetical protein